MEGVQPGSIEGVGHHTAHGAHIEVRVGRACAVAGRIPQPRREAVVLGGVGVHDEDLWVGAVLFDPEGQRIFYFRRDVRHAPAGVIFDAARAAGDILPAAALRVVLFEDSARILRPGVLAQKLHKVALDASRRSGGFGL